MKNDKIARMRMTRWTVARLLRNIHIFDCVRVTWIDSMGVTNSWEMKKELESLLPSSCESVGFVLDSTKDYSTICQSMSDRQVLARLTIPTVAIQTLHAL